MNEDILNMEQAAPTLTFEPFAEEAPKPELVLETQPPEEVKQPEVPAFDESSLTQEERKMVEDFTVWRRGAEKDGRFF